MHHICDHACHAGFKEVPWGEKQSLVGQVFSSVASKYDIMNDLMSVGMHRLWKDHLVHETLRPSSGQRHLDVAGGTGDVAFRVLRAIRQAESRSKATGEPGSVVVCDINPEMLAEGKKKAEVASDLARDKGLSFVEGDAESLPAFPDASFDSYSIAFGIRNVTDRAAALREALRVLRPGGRFLCLEFSHVTQPGIREVLGSGLNSSFLELTFLLLSCSRPTTFIHSMSSQRLEALWQMMHRAISILSRAFESSRIKKPLLE